MTLSKLLEIIRSTIILIRAIGNHPIFLLWVVAPTVLNKRMRGKWQLIFKMSYGEMCLNAKYQRSSTMDN